MNKSLKAVLLSALVFPGAGHFSLRKPVQGSALLGLTAIFSYFLITAIVEIAQQLSLKIQSGEIPLDFASISRQVSMQLESSDSQMVSISSITLMVLWLVGVVDSYRIGRSQAKQNAINING